MADIAESWSCPRCNRTWSRMTGQPLEDWADNLVLIQIAHGRRHDPRSAR